MRKFNALLVFLISSLAITGISFIDGKIWDVIFILVGMLVYSIVGILFSIGVLYGKEAGKDAYAFVFLLLLLAGYAVYKGLEKLRLFLLSWPLSVKIIVLSIIIVTIVAMIIFIILKNKNQEVE